MPNRLVVISPGSLCSQIALVRHLQRRLHVRSYSFRQPAHHSPLSLLVNVVPAFVSGTQSRDPCQRATAVHTCVCNRGRWFYQSVYQRKGLCRAHLATCAARLFLARERRGGFLRVLCLCAPRSSHFLIKVKIGAVKARVAHCCKLAVGGFHSSSKSYSDIKCMHNVKSGKMCNTRVSLKLRRFSFVSFSLNRLLTVARQRRFVLNLRRRESYERRVVWQCSEILWDALQCNVSVEVQIKRNVLYLQIRRMDYTHLRQKDQAGQKVTCTNVS